MEKTIIFNHIPRTGGTTLRVILNRVYGSEHVFFINSREIPISLEKYKNLSPEEKSHYKVISGHGALHFLPADRKVFTITILRDPVSLFLSQFHYLSRSENSNFLEEVSALASVEDYIEYAVSNGQDNMMVRCLDPKNQQFTMIGALPPTMDHDGGTMLQRAIKSLKEHDAVMELNNFDQELYRLSLSLGWKRIPLYRARNKTTYRAKFRDSDEKSMKRLEELLKYDIELYRHYIEKMLPARHVKKRKGARYRAFIARQKLIRTVMK